MLATNNTPKVQAPFGVSLLQLVLIIQGYNQNYMKYRVLDNISEFNEWFGYRKQNYFETYNTWIQDR
jgi:hypothetical protein